MFAFNALTVFASLSLLAVTLSQAWKRLYYHSLSRYPGPRLAALTSWYRAYYDIVKDGGWSEHLEHLHNRYGE